ncbi:MAG: amidohydrolase [Bacteroidaceae bacterium]|nr:amidohydrolase [Bacteroidaceae bacterium]
MTISLLQNDIVWGDPNANQENIAEILWGLDKSDVYVLPEMFSTGFAVDPHGIAEQDESSLTWMKEMAAELKGAVCGSVATEVDGNYYNRLYFVKPNGDVVTYDKHHLFTYADEHRHYKRGSERTVVEFRGCRFLLQVCYDLRFPCFSRNNERIPYDCAIYVASWPTSRLAVWDTLLHARAIENQCYVAGVNRIGEDQACQYSGGTLLVDPYGNTAAACPLDEDSAITVELDLQKLRDFRRKFPVLKDAD